MANQTHTTTYTYTTYPSCIRVEDLGSCILGLLAGSGDAITSAYDTFGELASVSNSLGQTISYSNYNARGQAQHIVGANGEVTDITYDARGRVANVRTYPNGSAADTAYTYDGSGLPTQITEPDGSTTHYVYDDTRHLTNVIHDAPNTLAGGAVQEV